MTLKLPPPDPVREQWSSVPAADPRPSDLIRAPLQSGFARIEFKPVPITELGPSVPPNWLWRGYVARGHSTLLTSLWKAGKTTLVSYVLRDLLRGGSLISQPMSGPALVISEEKPDLWKVRRDDLGLTDKLHLVCKPFRARPTPCQWTDYLGQIGERVVRSGYQLVVLDTLASLWPVINENDASDVQDSLYPTHAVTDAGAALLLVFHPRKSDGTEGQATRGSGALPGFVDTIVEMRRFAPNDRGDRRRVLTGYGRFDETPSESVIELGGDGYVVLGDRAHMSGQERMAIIQELLPEGPPGLTAKEVRVRFPGVKPGQRSIEEDLSRGIELERWQVSGTGKRNNARRFYRGAVFDSRKDTSCRCANGDGRSEGNP